jgi:hypothetical protein
MQAIDSSFRDPSGYIFIKGNKFYRAINNSYRENFDFFETSGLYENLLDKGQILSFKKVPQNSINSNKNLYKVICPDQLRNISYPYEWCFSQLKDAALLTLDIQEESMKFNMSLKDASAYNIQFHNGLPVMIDTLSFEKYNEGEPWIAYKQFCQHFLAPLILSAYVDIKSIKLLHLFIDGISLDYVVKQLPLKSFFRPSIFMHIYMHAKAQNINSDKTKLNNKNISKVAILGLIGSLRSLIRSLNWSPIGTEWGEYYSDTNYSAISMGTKQQIISEIIDEFNPKVLWDIGGNNGEFTRLASNKGIDSILFDIDYAAIEKSYRKTKEDNEENIASFVMDFTNPSSGLGWNNKERLSIFNRSNADIVFGLALIHHLCISNNLPLDFVATFFFKLTSKYLVIEFVPKSDSKVKRLLDTRKDIFTEYDQKNFENKFLESFRIIKTIQVENSDRIIYLMEKRA